jgi:arylsulfatase A-like enzyme
MIASKRIRILLSSAAVLTGTSVSALAEVPIAPDAADSGSGASAPTWPRSTRAPAGAPNVIVILLDDVGFSTSGALGGPVHTPVIDGLAHAGLLYNNFHVNAVCSPTRAALLSGRNNHQVGFGTISEAASDHPGYNSIWPKSAASIAEVLKNNGYNTAAFGKWHNTPAWETSAAGPFERWPTGLGFEYFYGFIAGQDDQWVPRLYRDTYPVEPKTTPEKGYHLTTDLTDDAIKWLHQHDAVAPQKPFFLYFSTGATHKPHHVAREWIVKYKGRFNQGWDTLREETFKRQKAMGIIPANAELTPRPKEIPAWDSLTADEKTLLAHQMEVYAAFMEQTDHEVGRLLQAVRDEGQWDNTLVLYIVGDNGASAEGGLLGGDLALMSSKPAPVSERLKIMDKLGSDAYMNHFAVGWAWGLDVPFQWTKQVASHLGGTTDPLIVSWPARIKTKGVRGQFQHVTDIAPTIYEAAGITPPDMVDGVKQMPLEGSSLLYSFNAPDAPSDHPMQVFETMSNIAIYRNGWWAGRRSYLPWNVFSPDRAAAPERPWELYDLTNDYSQAHDLAASHPDKLKEMQALFDSEAKRTNIYPISSEFRFYLAAPNDDCKHFVFRSGVERIPPQDIHAMKWTSHTIAADLIIPSGKPANGVIIAQGGSQAGSTLGGFSLYVKDGHPVYEVIAYGNPAGKIVSPVVLKPGKAHIVVDVDLVPIPPGANAMSAYYGQTHGTAKLIVDGKPAGETKIANISAVIGESLDIGKDLGSPASFAYRAPFAFDGTIDKVMLDFK